MTETPRVTEAQRKANKRLAILLFGLSAAFFFGFMALEAIR